MLATLVPRRWWWWWRFHDEEHANLLNSMWLTAITFLCVGYGDIVPNTYCGRGITLTCGMVVSNRFPEGVAKNLKDYFTCPVNEWMNGWVMNGWLFCKYLGFIIKVSKEEEGRIIEWCQRNEMKCYKVMTRGNSAQEEIVKTSRNSNNSKKEGTLEVLRLT